MKNEIIGIDLSSTIKNVSISTKDGNKVIIVNYLDNTTDYFNFNKKNYDKIIDKMEDQAQKYVENKKEIIKEAKNKQRTDITKGISISLILFLASLFFSNIGCDLLYVILAVSATTSIPLTIGIASIAKYKASEDLEKYEVFLKNQEAFEKECELLHQKEHELGNKEVNINESIDITTVDNYSYEELIDELKRLDRYKEIDEDILPKVIKLKR